MIIGLPDEDSTTTPLLDAAISNGRATRVRDGNGQRVRQASNAPLEVARREQYDAGAEAVNEEGAFHREEPGDWSEGHGSTIQQNRKTYGGQFAQGQVELVGWATTRSGVSKCFIESSDDSPAVL